MNQHDMKKYRCAVIGAGNISTTRHVPALHRSSRTKIVGVIDRKQSKADTLKKISGAQYSSDTMDVEWFSNVDFVTIGVPPHVHFSTAWEALQRGKHVLLEKPMTMTLEEGKKLRDFAKEQQKIFAVVQNFQFAHSAIKLKRMIQSGEIGEITSIFCFQTSTKDRRLPIWHEELPLGLFYDESPHLMYLLKAFTPKSSDITVNNVHIVPSRTGKVTPAIVTAQIDVGSIPAVLYNNFEAPISEWQFIVYGTKRAACIDIFRDILVQIPHDGEHYAKDVLRSSLWMVGTHLFGFLSSGIKLLQGKLSYGNDEVLHRFLNAIETGLEPEGISAEDGLKVLELQHEILSYAGK